MAINFPNSPLVNDTHVVGDITWTWDGTSWNANSSGASLPIATAADAGIVKVDNTTITVTGDGTISSIASGDVNKAPNSTDNAIVRFDSTTGDTLQNSLVTISDVGAIVAPAVEGTVIPFYYSNQNAFPSPSTYHGAILHSHQDGRMYFAHSGAWVAIANQADNATLSRSTANATTTSILDGSADNITITGFKSYYLLKIETSAAAWVTVYSDTASRTADAARAETTDPLPGSGVIAEAITTGADTLLITPGVFGFNDESPVTTDIPLKVVNKSGASAAITVTLTIVQVEG